MKHLTDQDFNTIKVMINAGIKTRKISEVTGRSGSTVSVIARSDTFEGYQTLLKESRKRNANEVIGDDAPITAAGLKELLTILNKHLDAIERKLGI
jgi:hypothetical protein